MSGKPTPVATRVAVLEAVLDERFTGHERALTLAKESIDERLKGMNEFREQLRSQAALFITRQEYNLVQDVVNRQSGQLLLAATRTDLDNHSIRNDTGIRLISERLARLETRFLVGGSGIVILLTVLQLVINYLGHK